MTDHLTIVDHPLVQHKLSLMREKDTSTKFMCIYATRLFAGELRNREDTSSNFM